ncbi:MAG: methylmalonyl-CoA mutase family protein [bacterium]
MNEMGDVYQEIADKRKKWEENLKKAEKDILFTPLDFSDAEYLKKLSFPGEYPYTRGVHPTMYRGRPWTMRQYAGFGDAEQTNARFRYLLEQGQTGLSVAFDLPTQMGYDSDDPMSLGEVGRTGVAIDSVHDMEILFNEIDLGRVSTSMTINAPAAVLLAMYAAVAEKGGVSTENLNGTIQNDILKEYAARGTYIFPVEPSIRITTDIFKYCSKFMPKWNTISISGYHIREAGSTAVQEVAFTLANGIHYVQSAIEAGLDVDEFAGRLSFFFNAHNNFLEEVAKFRAARRLWAKIMKERFKAKSSRSCMMRYHVQTAGSMLTAQQPENNTVRVAFQALAAVLGGAQSIHTNSRDEALSLPSEDSVTIALRTQQIIAYETGVTDSVDPLGGSYYIETLTERIEAEAQKYIEEIDRRGGAAKAIAEGYIQREIANSAYRWQQEVEAEKKVIVGVNKYISESTTVKPFRHDPQTEKKQIEKLRRYRRDRNQRGCGRTIDALKRGAEKAGENLMPLIYECVRAEATTGEICAALKDVFGEYRESVVI